MAQYFTDFTESNSAVDMTIDLSELAAAFDHDDYQYGFPLMNVQNAWGGIWTVGYDLSGTRVIRHSGANARAALLWYKPGVFADAVVSVKAYLETGVVKSPGVILCGSGNAAKENAYVIMAHPTAGAEFSITRYSAGSASVLGTTAKTYTRDNWYNIKAERTGTTIRGRIWKDGDAEPGTWDLSYTNSDLTRGYCGLFDYYGVTGSSYFKDLRIVGTPVSPDNWFHGWTRPVKNFIPYVGADATASGSKALVLANPTDAGARKFYAWSTPVANDIVEVVTRLKMSVRASTTYLLKIQCNGVVSENGYWLAAADGSGGIRLIQYIGGTATILDNTTLASANFAYNADTWIWVRMYHNRTTRALKVKAWADGSAEPGTYQIDTTAPTGYDATGSIGVGGYDSDAGTQSYDIIGVGTGGDAAPTEAPA